MSDDEDAFPAVLAHHGIQHAAQSQDHVAPALAARWTKVELADASALFGKLGVALFDGELGQPVQDAELLLAQPLVGGKRHSVLVDPGLFQKQQRGRPSAQVGRTQHHIGTLFRRQIAKPSAKRARLLLSQCRKRRIDIACHDVDQWQ